MSTWPQNGYLAICSPFELNQLYTSGFSGSHPFILTACANPLFKVAQRHHTANKVTVPIENIRVVCCTVLNPTGALHCTLMSFRRPSSKNDIGLRRTSIPFITLAMPSAALLGSNVKVEPWLKSKSQVASGRTVPPSKHWIQVLLMLLFTNTISMSEKMDWISAQFCASPTEI